MLRRVALLPIALMSACAGGCSIVRALYVAVVHNSGAPPHEEMVRIDERERAFLRTLAHRRVLILPVAVLGRAVRYDTSTAAAIAEQLRANHLGLASAGAEPDRAAVRAAAERGGDSLVALQGACGAYRCASTERCRLRVAGRRARRAGSR